MRKSFRVPQQRDFPITYKSSGWDFLFAKLSSDYRYKSENSVFEKIGDAIIITITAPRGLLKIAIMGNSVAKLQNYSEFKNFKGMISKIICASPFYIIIKVVLRLMIIGRYFCFDTS